MENNPPSPATSESSTATRVFGTRISDRDLTEIELHSVESINDLHRTHPEPNHKVRQGSALQSLSEAVRTGEQAVALRISELIQELKILRNNLTAITEGSRSGQ
ncbi:uncharacterized protein si:dkey-20d21.12 isoform X2 [Esox lucius]|uniref:uncharacterized protein si:dkey-20d21.12 isoform X2 n=1 Tax=Esox lucius TaxID=8010 RepID=UPI0014775042|nr:uncharacterized protein si:dkey-20d21.12 isoform X2 [Esox lucius]